MKMSRLPSPKSKTLAGNPRTRRGISLLLGVIISRVRRIPYVRP